MRGRIHPGRFPLALSARPPFSSTEPSLLPSGNNRISCWTSKVEPTREQITGSPGRVLSPSGPRDVESRAKLPGKLPYQCGQHDSCAIPSSACWESQEYCCTLFCHSDKQINTAVLKTTQKPSILSVGALIDQKGPTWPIPIFLFIFTYMRFDTRKVSRQRSADGKICSGWIWPTIALEKFRMR